jgi:hypothetical protein
MKVPFSLLLKSPAFLILFFFILNKEASATVFRDLYPLFDNVAVAEAAVYN